MINSSKNFKYWKSFPYWYHGRGNPALQYVLSASSIIINVCLFAGHICQDFGYDGDEGKNKYKK